MSVNSSAHTIVHESPQSNISPQSQPGTGTAYLLLYVDDIILTASSEILLQQILALLHQEFSMTNLGSLNYFLGILVTLNSSGMFLSQRKYATEILEQAHMAGCNPSLTPCISAEAEYCGVANAVAKTCWLWNLLRKLHTPLFSATLVYCDNVRVLHVPSRYLFANIFIKGLPSTLFEEF
ncbi:ribonuclease H-like domain-containing protein [Tanacetum coccineum]